MVWDSGAALGGFGGPDHEIDAARSSNDGSSWSQPFLVNTNATFDGSASDWYPTVRSGGSSKWSVAWQVPSMEVYSHSSDGGTTWSAPARVNAEGPYSGVDVGLATDGNSWLAAWSGNSGNDSDIFAAACDLTGPDVDGDGITDSCDNCPAVANSDQSDFDRDGVGLPCQFDPDHDGLSNLADNCPAQSNVSQLDSDSDGMGDACDPCVGSCPVDTDADTITDGPDNCRTIPNLNQLDGDTDGVGDSCDNCSTMANIGQLNTDNDAQGDACDDNDDNDAWPDVSDNCPTVATGWMVPAGDSDCDGYPSSAPVGVRAGEAAIGTDPNMKCPSTSVRNDEATDAWPPDMDDNQLVNLQDIGTFNMLIGARNGIDPRYTPRNDLNADNLINLQDLGQLNPFVGKRCVP